MLTAPQKIKQILIQKVTELILDAPDEIDNKYAELEENARDHLRDVMGEFRGGQFQTDLDGEYNRIYETKVVAAQMLDGSYAAWTYYYGGGKHGEPEVVEWVDDAFEVEAEDKVVTVKVFTKKAEKKPKKGKSNG